MSNETVLLSDIDIEATTDIEVRLSRITSQVELCDMLDEYNDPQNAALWLRDHGNAAEVFEAFDGDEDFARLVAAQNGPRKPLRADRAESMDESMACHWRRNGITIAAAVRNISGGYSMAVNFEGAIFRFAAENLGAADLLVDALLNAQAVES